MLLMNLMRYGTKTINNKMEDASIGFSPEGKFTLKLTTRTHNNLKCYEIIDGEITAISFVRNPANGVKAKIVSDEERIITGPILIPNSYIFRINPLTGEQYYIFFTKESINKIFLKYRKENWSEKERLLLIQMYSEGYSEYDIGQKLNRTESEVIDRIKKEGDVFRNMIIMLMSQNGKSINEISVRLRINVSELVQIIENIGGVIIRR